MNYNINSDNRQISRRIMRSMFYAGLFAIMAFMWIVSQVKAESVYLPVVTNNGSMTSSIDHGTIPATSISTPPSIAITEEITVTYDTVYVNTTITKSVKSALNYISMTNTQTMINVTKINMELGDLPHGTIAANAFSYTYHTATKDLPCAQIKVAFQVSEGKARNVIGKACYKTLFSTDPDVQYHDLYMAVNDQAELLK